MTDEQTLNAVLAELGYDDWRAGWLGDMLVCPHDHEVELDGTCNEGCVSPLIEHGLI